MKTVLSEDTVLHDPCNMTPIALTTQIINHAVRISEPSRNYMEKFNRAVPDLPLQYTGKMDHASCLAFKIGQRRSGKSQRRLTV